MIMKHSPSRQGDIAEFYAVTWLWDQGYEVFLNAGSSGIVDIIAWEPEANEFILIDVKTTRTKYKNHKSRSASNEETGTPRRTDIQKEKGVRILKYNADNRTLHLMNHKVTRQTKQAFRTKHFINLNGKLELMRPFYEKSD